MNQRLLRLQLALTQCIVMCIATFLLHADEVRMANGDRYVGKVLSVSADTVLFQSDVLGKIRLPREQVANVTFGTNTTATARALTNIAQDSVLADHLAPAHSSVWAGTNVDLSAMLRNLGTNTNFISQVRESMLGSNPEAASKYDELVKGLLGGELNMDDLRRQARASVDQLRSLKQDLGPEVDDALDGYLEILDHFLEQTDVSPTNATPEAPLKPHDH